VARFLRVPLENIRRVLRNFKGIPWRQELIGEIKGVRYFNDTTATMPEAAILAIRTISRRYPKSKIILIAGGQDKNLNYKNLSREISKRISHLILFSGNASDKIKKELKYFKKRKNPLLIFSEIESMEHAVREASELANRGDIVILSPGAASFNLFKNEFDRGEQFNKIVKRLKKI